MGHLTLERPWLTFDLGQEMTVLSWAVNRPGLVRAQQILWREVRNRDLPPELDAATWYEAELHQRGAAQAVGFLTSRDVRQFTEARAEVEGITAHVVATVGLSNAERIGHRLDHSGRDWGTINIALQLSEGITDAALIEAMSLVVQARTAAVIDAGLMLRSGLATGTGTDCVAVAAPTGTQPYAGLHTAIGEAIGKATYEAVATACADWMAGSGRQPQQG
ncbi:adenosylcobinamide amidohydrolase [Phaeobacter sp.]|uniref:adenosylcobinamide amidohydrolase n=1 Tax=Phaeobacter sp. TaxID=1902409 RepID=UPI0025D45904|nr:adenosylcobinamide amidohydrolase [Phaeobacter sp.]